MKPLTPLLLFVLTWVSIGAPPAAHAWGRRGHAIVCETAASILAARVSRSDFLKTYAFDLGYYCNVPDLVWKKPATYETEAPNHYMDLEIFNRAFKAAAPAVSPHPSPFLLTRAEFEKKYPSVGRDAGRAYWRITELVKTLSQTSESLRSPTPERTRATRHDLQETWLVTAGALGHYVGDLSQPLHVTENYDGQLTGQKGIHAYFEEVLVDELSNGEQPAQLADSVGREALKGWHAYDKASAKLSTLELIEQLADASNATIKQILKTDASVGRKNTKAAAKAFEPLIRARLVAGALTLAEIWNRQLGWTFDNEKFYNFAPAPIYLPPNGP